VVIERIVAPNPGPMTLTGTNTYLVDSVAGDLSVIDPGPADTPTHLAAILKAIEHRGGALTSVIVTHRHLDHLPAAMPLCEQTGATLLGHPALPGVQRGVCDGELAFGELVAYHTPGHTRDSICLWLADQHALFTGDLVLGTGTAVLDDAPGALSDYMGSLRRLLELAPRTVYPGHGPIVDHGVGKLQDYVRHREQRVEQVLVALASGGPATPDQLAAAIYTEIAPNLLPMAARNVRANLEMLLGQRRVEHLGDERWRLTQ
jgi:glyoxylase-like metal-dependent hydrolase (beta-lactamase superfamily II)